jgi:hypothetical protein
MWFVADYSETLEVFFYPIQIPLSPDKHTVCPQSPLGVLKNCGANKLTEMSTGNIKKNVSGE